VTDADRHQLLISLGLLVGWYLAARGLSYLIGWQLKRAARAMRQLDERLMSALRRPVTYALFLMGAWTTIHRLELPLRALERLDQALFVLGSLMIAVALIRAYDILIGWFSAEAQRTGNGAAAEVGPLLSKLGKLAIALLATIAVLQELGVNVQSLVVSLGIGSLAVGLAAQDTLANMFAGFTLLLDRPFKVGDRIQLATGELGDVETIGIRATRLRTSDETTLIVPNSALTKDRLVNFSQPSRRLTLRIDVAVAFGTDLEQARQVLAEAALAVARLDPDQPPVVVITRFAEHAVQLRLVCWVRDYTEQALAVSEVHEQVYRRLAQAGIEIPFPVHRIIHSGAAPPPVREGVA